MARRIIWSQRAHADRKSILKYWKERTRSIKYSKKLNELFISSAEFVSIYPHTGRPTTKENIKIKFVSHYALELQEIWDKLN